MKGLNRRRYTENIAKAGNKKQIFKHLALLYRWCCNVVLVYAGSKLKSLRSCIFSRRIRNRSTSNPYPWCSCPASSRCGFRLSLAWTLFQLPSGHDHAAREDREAGVDGARACRARPQTVGVAPQIGPGSWTGLRKAQEDMVFDGEIFLQDPKMLAFFPTSRAQQKSSMFFFFFQHVSPVLGGRNILKSLEINYMAIQ